MKQAIQALNDLCERGFIETYAIGGGMAVVFYAEPVLTFDLDIYILLPADDSALLSLASIYEELSRQGCQPQNEQIIIGGTPVQFIPAYNALVEEAVRGAREIQIEGEPTRIVSIEHLIAILLQTYRGKDKQRALMLIEREEYEGTTLESILRRFDLVERWNDFKERFL